MKRFLNTVRAYGSFAIYGLALFLLAAPHLYAIIGWDALFRVSGSRHRRRVAAQGLDPGLQQRVR